MRTYFSRNQWKYLSLALMGIIRLGVSTLQANAATKDLHQQIIHVLNLDKLKTDKIPTIGSSVDAIKSQTATCLLDSQVKVMWKMQVSEIIKATISTNNEDFTIEL